VESGGMAPRGGLTRNLNEEEVWTLKAMGRDGCRPAGSEGGGQRDTWTGRDGCGRPRSDGGDGT
jgi:hypothetical protein